ncbi:Integrase zinc binding domain [Popillia japonica]|uniref:RNA-directed DNA polymerase n=1 Tax=Popillia japonica TaxID=7064 RepID=A0AAW1LUA1_POPJA
MKKRDLTPRIAIWVLRLQEYDFDIEHRCGGHMVHVDALSRHPTGEAKESDAAALTVLSLQDPKLVEIRNTLARQPQNNTEKQMHTDYKLNRNRLYRKTDSGTKWVVPKGIRWRVIKGCHDDMGHFGYDKTLEQLKQYYWFPKIAKKVRSYLSSCIECAYHKGKPEGQLYNIERVPIPFHTAHIDHLGPFPKTVKDTKTNNVIKLLEDVFSVFGPPDRLVSDRGAAFTSKTFESFCIDNDITHIKNATATPRANGQIEIKAVKDTKTNNVIKLLEDVFSVFGPPDRLVSDRGAAFTSKTFESFCIDNDITHIKNATATLPQRRLKVSASIMILRILKMLLRLLAQTYALNGTINKTTGQSAHTLLLSYKPRNALQNKLVLALLKEEPGNLDEIRGEALKKIQCMQEKQKEYFDKHHRPARHYQSGDLVLIYREPTATGESRKLRPRFKGPYQISKVLGRGVLLSDVPSAQRTQRKFESVYAADVLKPWCTLELEEEIEDNSSSSEAELLEEEPGSSSSEAELLEEEPGSGNSSGMIQKSSAETTLPYINPNSKFVSLCKDVTGYVCCPLETKNITSRNINFRSSYSVYYIRKC